jgi:EAL domain-containing protein
MAARKSDSRFNLPTARVCMASSKSSQRDPPNAFSRRMATSASFNKSSHRLWMGVLSAIPMLNATRTSWESTKNGSDYQPLLQLATRRLVSLEALLRWDHPSQGLISPYRFLEAAEDSGILISIGHWLMLEACRQLHEWQMSGYSERPVKITVNLSARQFADPAGKRHSERAATNCHRTLAAATGSDGMRRSSRSQTYDQRALSLETSRNWRDPRRLRYRDHFAPRPAAVSCGRTEDRSIAGAGDASRPFCRRHR